MDLGEVFGLLEYFGVYPSGISVTFKEFQGNSFSMEEVSSK